MALHYTPEEKSRILTAARHLHNDMGHIPQNERNAYNIAAMRYLTAQGSPGSKWESDYILLYKLVYDARDGEARAFIVTNDRAAIAASVLYDKLGAKYVQFARRNGYGSWFNATHESAMYSLMFADILGSSRTPIVLHRASYEGMLQKYTVQALEAVTSQSSMSIKDRMAQDATELYGSISERKQAAMESRCTCYICGAPKPRRITCQVCGYTPSRG